LDSGGILDAGGNGAGAENQQVVLKISTLVFVLTINVLVTIFEKRVLKISTFPKKYCKNKSDNKWHNKCS
jgi:hypothetical protein